MFWAWLLKYSSFFITGVVSFIVSYIVYRLTNRFSDLIYYTSHPAWVTLPPQQNVAAVGPMGTFTLFLWNPGRAPARDVHVGHFWLPANNVYPDIPRNITQTAGGGWAIQFPVIPPKTAVSISYLYFGPHSVEQIVSYVGWEEGSAKRIPVILQRVWPKWFNVTALIVLLAGMWVVVNVLFSLIKYLWIVYH
jgi:hypothetical protein